METVPVERSKNSLRQKPLRPGKERQRKGKKDSSLEAKKGIRLRKSKNLSEISNKKFFGAKPQNLYSPLESRSDQTVKKYLLKGEVTKGKMILTQNKSLQGPRYL